MCGAANEVRQSRPGVWNRRRWDFAAPARFRLRTGVKRPFDRSPASSITAKGWTADWASGRSGHKLENVRSRFFSADQLALAVA